MAYGFIERSIDQSYFVISALGITMRVLAIQVSRAAQKLIIIIIISL